MKKSTILKIAPLIAIVLLSIALLPTAFSYQKLALTERDMGGGVFPVISLLGLLFSSILLIVRTIRDSKSVTGDEVTKERIVGERKLLSFLILTVIYIATIEYFGFIINTIFYLSILFKLYGYGNIYRGILISVALSLGLAILFGGVLLLPFPKGHGIFYNLSDSIIWYTQKIVYGG